MSGTIKELSLTYDPVNDDKTFTNGDVINGTVTLEVSKEVKVNSLYIKCKGDANVRWTEKHGDTTRTYSSHDRYFKLKQHFILDPSKKGHEEPGVIISEGEIYNNVVKPGRHVYPFRFQLPHGDFPVSFRGNYGKVKYILEVTTDRSWRMDKTTEEEITFLPGFHSADVNLMNPQSGTVEKKMKLFTSGHASVRASINKMAFVPGEAIKISSDVDNSSSRDLKLKYSLDQKQTFHADGHTRHSSKNIFRVVGDPVPSRSKQTINTDLVLPKDMELTIKNCRIITLEYLLKVYLDVPYAFDPEVIFPIVILPPARFAPWPNQPNFQAPGGAGWSNIPPPQMVLGPSPELYPNLYPPNPEAPPPSYAMIYPNPNQTTPGLNPDPSAPAYTPPQYPAMGYPNPAVPQQLPTPSAPPYIPAGGAAQSWPNSDMQPDPFSVKIPEKNE